MLSGDEIIGYTVGNDMSSRSIEGSNPLYLPQAKVYDRCCAVGPCVRSASSIEDPHDLEIWMTISRNQEVLYNETTSTSKMVRSVDELVDYYTKHNIVSNVSVLLTGTSLVPDDGFTLHEGDLVEMGIEGSEHSRTLSLRYNPCRSSVLCSPFTFQRASKTYSL